MKLFKEVTVKQTKLMANGLREYREEHQIGLRELARITNIAPSTISSIELGLGYTRKRTAEKIENALFQLSKEN